VIGQDYLTRVFGPGPVQRVALAREFQTGVSAKGEPVWDFQERIFRWPAQQDEMHAWVTGVPDCNVYVCPRPLAIPLRKKGQTEDHGVAWADVDYQGVPTEKRDTVRKLIAKLAWFTVESGSERVEGFPNVHVYVKLDRAVDARTVFKLNDGLRVLLHADSKHTDNSLLRLPGTVNQKTGRRVVLRPGRGGARSVDAWLAHPVLGSGRWPEDAVGDGGGAWVRVEVPALPGPLRMALRMDSDEALDRYGARFKAVLAVTRDLAKFGLSRDQIHSAMDGFSPAVDKCAEEHGGYDLHADVDWALGPVEPKSPTPPQPVEDTPIGAYPLAFMPQLVRDAVKAGGSLPMEGLAAAALSVLGGLCLRSTYRFRGGGRCSDRKGMGLWIPIVGDPGSGKTPCIDMMWRPVLNQEGLRLDAYLAAMEEWEAGGRKGTQPKDKSLVLGDLTSEALMSRLGERAQRVIKVDEIASLFTSLGQYKQVRGNDADRLLSMWGNAGFRVDRKNGAPFRVADPAVGVIGTVQYERVRAIAELNSGMQARWLPHMVEPRGEKATEYGSSLPAWEDRVVELYMDESKRTNEWVIDTDSKLWVSAEERWRKVRDTHRGVSTAVSFIAKADIHAARVAVSFAEGDLGTGGVVPEDNMLAAVRLVDYCMSLWTEGALPDTSEVLTSRYSDKPFLAQVDNLNRHLSRQPDGKATLRELLRSNVCGVREMDSLRKLVEVYGKVHGESLVREEKAANGRVVTVVYARVAK